MMSVPPPLPGLVPLQPLLARALFASMGAFIADQALSPGFADAALRADWRDGLWSRHWPTLRRLPPHDLRVALCFVLACALLGLDTQRGLAFAGQARQPARWMRLFLADHGLMAYASMEPPACAPGPAPGPTSTPVSPVSSGVSRRRTTGAIAPRPAEAPA